MKKSAKSAIRNNNSNNVKEIRSVKFTKVPYRNCNVTICNLPGYTFELQRLYKSEYKKYGEYSRIAERDRLVVTAENDKGEIKIMRCFDECLYGVKEVFNVLKQQGYTKKQRMYELTYSYTDSLSMDLYYAQFDYDFEGEILDNAFEGKSAMFVNFIRKGKFVCRI